MTKLRVGLVSENKDLLGSVKENLPASYVYCSKTLFELSQNYGNHKLDAVIFTEGSQPAEASIQASLNFLRQKNNFKESLVFFIHNRPDLKLKGLLFDPLIRSYSAAGGTLIPMLQLQTLANSGDAKKFSQPLNPEWLQAEFQKPLASLISANSDFQCSNATDEESHSGFLCQKSDEIASNLVWMKFTARILKDDCDGLKQMFPALSEQEMEETAEVMLDGVLAHFKEQVVLKLKDDGAVFLQGSDYLTAQERIELVKRGRPSTLIFKSTACHVLLEQVRYT